MPPGVTLQSVILNKAFKKRVADKIRAVRFVYNTSIHMH